MPLKWFPFFQAFAFCGPKEESCVGNQTLKDKSCLIPCSGLYADIADDSLKRTTHAIEQNVMQGRMWIWFVIFWFNEYYLLVFRTLDGAVWWRGTKSQEIFGAALQKMHIVWADDGEDGVTKLTEKYHKYKREYVKHLSFVPEEDILSKFFLWNLIVF